MKFLFACLWALTCTVSFLIGKNATNLDLPSRRPASVEKSIEVIGQKVDVLVGQEKRLKYTAKVDTGAESSSLHGEDIKVHWVIENKRSIPYVSFRTIDDQKNVQKYFRRVSKIDDVKNANGKMIRYYIKEKIFIQNKELEIDLSLTDRSDLTFKFLLGKNALNPLGLLVDTSKDTIIYDNPSPRYVYRKQ